MAIMKFSTTHLNNLFSGGENGYEWDSVKNLMFDLSDGLDICDEEGNKINKKEAEAKMRNIMFSVLGLDASKVPTKRDIKRAFNRHGEEFFEVIEELVDIKVNTGLQANDFFNDFVDYRNIALGDSNEFYTEDKTILAVGKVAGSHHDFSLQRLGAGESTTIPMSTYGAAVGADIARYLVGQEDWAKLVTKLGEAFTKKLTDMVYAEVMNAYQQIPVSSAQNGNFVGNGTLVKATLDTIIENVGGLNDSDVYILGTKTALKQLNTISDVNWRAEIDKEAVSRTGRLGWYESTDLIEIPQRFDNNDVTRRLVSDKILLIMPKTSDNKFVWVVDQGETLIDEITERGEEHGRIDDVMKYEMQRSFGVTTKIGRYFGAWILP